MGWGKYFCILLYLISAPVAADSVVHGTEVLPKGARVFFYQRRAYEVNGEFSSGGNFSPLSYDAPIYVKTVIGSAKELEDISKGLGDDEIKMIEDAQLADLSFKPNIELSVDVFGLAWGLSEKLMIGFGFPVYDAKVTLNHELKTTKESTEKVAAELRRRAGEQGVSDERRDRLFAMASALESAPEIYGAHIQYYLTNNLGYKPLGNWEARDIGDTRVFTHYNYHNDPIFHHGARLGAILPTGRKDDPDLLSDFSFSNEAFGLYLESRHDIDVIPNLWTISGSALYEHSFESDREMRIPDGDSAVSSQKATLNYQRGDTTEARLGTGLTFWKNTGLNAHYVWHKKNQDEYAGYALLSQGTDNEYSANVFTLTYSTVNDYQNKKFEVPMRVALSRYEMLSGQQVEKLDYTFLELQVYF